MENKIYNEYFGHIFAFYNNSNTIDDNLSNNLYYILNIEHGILNDEDDSYNVYNNLIIV